MLIWKIQTVNIGLRCDLPRSRSSIVSPMQYLLLLSLDPVLRYHLDLLLLLLHPLRPPLSTGLEMCLLLLLLLPLYLQTDLPSLPMKTILSLLLVATVGLARMLPLSANNSSLVLNGMIQPQSELNVEDSDLIMMIAPPIMTLGSSFRKWSKSPNLFQFHLRLHLHFRILGSLLQSLLGHYGIICRQPHDTTRNPARLPAYLPFHLHLEIRLQFLLVILVPHNLHALPVRWSQPAGQ